MIEFNATFLVAMLSFVVFILIMNAIFYNPILSIMRKRNAYIDSNYQESKDFEKSAQEYEQTHSQKIEETQERCRLDFKKQIESEQTKSVNEIKSKKDSIKSELKTKKEDLESKENKLRKEMQENVVNNLADLITEKLTVKK